jgi:hypothetical protein
MQVPQDPVGHRQHPGMDLMVMKASTVRNLQKTDRQHAYSLIHS